MAVESPTPEEIDPLSLFEEEWREPVVGLMYLGQLSETVDFCGHTFTLRTLLPQDRFAIASVLQPYRNTLMEADAFQAAHVSASLVAVDNDEDFCPPIGPRIEGFIQGRLSWVGKNLYPPTVQFLWGSYQVLEAKAAYAMKELDRLSKGSQPTNLPPWLDSLIDKGSLNDETPSDTLPFTPSSSDS